jgi:hypothetical protein
MQDLDRDLPVQGRMLRREDGRHATAADRLDQAVPTELLWH